MYGRRWFRYCVGILLVIAILVISWRYRLAIQSRVLTAYWQHRCLSYERTAGRVAYEGDPTRVAQLLADGAMFKDPMASAAYYVAPEWTKLQSTALPRSFRSSQYLRPATVFLHRRRSNKGNERLVLVMLYVTERFPLIAEKEVKAFVLIPSSWGSPPRFAFDPPPGQSWTSVFMDARVDEGVPDSADESHFTIHVNGGVNGESPRKDRTIDGWLRDDDTVELKWTGSTQ